MIICIQYNNMTYIRYIDGVWMTKHLGLVRNWRCSADGLQEGLVRDELGRLDDDSHTTREVGYSIIIT